MARTNGILERGRQELDEIEEMGKRVAARGAARARKASRAVQDAASEVGSQATEIRHDMESVIANRPITSVLVAAGVGFLLAKLWR